MAARGGAVEPGPGEATGANEAGEASLAPEASERLLRGWAREPGRAVLVRVEWADGSWEGGVGADEPRPAASLLKVPLAMAVEDAFRSGVLHPDAAVAAGSLAELYGDAGAGALRVLDPGLLLSAADVLGLCLALSDRACATWLLAAVGVEAVRSAMAAAGCAATTVHVAPHDPGGPLVGRTTARDALLLVDAATDAGRQPVTARALANGVRDSRIPLGATDLDVRIAHKTGSLPGVAHDVAVIDCDGGRLLAAFLAEAQHDTLVTGYEMGICTRGLLQAWGFAVRGPRSLA